MSVFLDEAMAREFLERSLVDLADGSQDRGMTPFHVVIAGRLDATLVSVVMDALADVESRLRNGDGSVGAMERRHLLELLAHPKPLVPETSATSSTSPTSIASGLVVSLIALLTVELGAAAATALASLGQRAGQRVSSARRPRATDR